MLLEIKNLDVGYGYPQILRKVSLNIDKGEYVCIVGPNGAISAGIHTLHQDFLLPTA